MHGRDWLHIQTLVGTIQRWVVSFWSLHLLPEKFKLLMFRISCAVIISRKFGLTTKTNTIVGTYTLEPRPKNLNSPNQNTWKVLNILSQSCHYGQRIWKYWKAMTWFLNFDKNSELPSGALFLALFTIIVETQHHCVGWNAERRQLDEESNTGCLSHSSLFLAIAANSSCFNIAVLATINQEEFKKSWVPNGRYRRTETIHQAGKSFWRRIDEKGDLLQFLHFNSLTRESFRDLVQLYKVHIWSHGLTPSSTGQPWSCHLSCRIVKPQGIVAMTLIFLLSTA